MACLRRPGWMIAQLYQVTVNDLISEEEPRMPSRKPKVLILLLALGLVLPFVTPPFFNLCEDVVGAPISQALRSGIYYCILFVVCVIIFHKFLLAVVR